MNDKELSRGDIVLVDFGKENGSEQSFERPAVVISNDYCNAYSNVVVVCPLTSSKKSHVPYQFKIFRRVGEGFLSGCSTILCEQIRAIDKTRIIDFNIDKLTYCELRRFEDTLRFQLDL